jgi:UDP-N-acetylglucosamine--N-acetylmuramyl-(pentapeptide) pyrophosphoryl-undecaprenol N-acetylglucosamine transferase
MCGGGTGGHLAIIKSVKEQLLDSDLVYIGSTNGQDRAWFGDDNSFQHKYFLESRGVVNQNLFGKIKSIFMLIKL